MYVGCVAQGCRRCEIGIARGALGVLRHVRRLGLELEGRCELVCDLSAVCSVASWGGGLLVWSVMQLIGLLFLLLGVECVLWEWFHIDANCGWCSDSESMSVLCSRGRVNHKIGVFSQTALVSHRVGASLLR